jgi:hypothetical protein
VEEFSRFLRLVLTEEFGRKEDLWGKVGAGRRVRGNETIPK